MSFQPPGGSPYPPPPPNNPQQPWSPQPQWNPVLPPKKRGNGWKWALGAVALVAVIGVTAAVTVSVTKNDDTDGDGSNPPGETYGLASADDKGPANIITEDPTCAAWRPINQTLAEVQRKGWDRRDPAIPAEDWTREQRSHYEEVGLAMRETATRVGELVKITPHRVLRELYQQFIAFARAYSDAIPVYSPIDNHLAGVVVSTSSTLAFVCASIEWGSAQARAPLVKAPPPPSELRAPSNPSDPSRFLLGRDPSCPELFRLLRQFDTDTMAWQGVDANIPASNWTQDQKEVAERVAPVMSQLATNLEHLGLASANQTLQDFAIFSAQYRRAYVQALPTYRPSDSFLARTAARTTSVIYEACKAAGN
ncbi:hypothetical protein [Mycolicibacterium sp. XJ1819]